MDFPIQHYKENGAEEQLQQSLAMRTEWEPCLAHHPPLQSFGCDAELAERGGGPPPPPPPSKRRFRGPTSRNKANDSAMCATMDDRHGKMRETLMGRQVIIQSIFVHYCFLFFLFPSLFFCEYFWSCWLQSCSVRLAEALLFESSLSRQGRKEMQVKSFGRTRGSCWA